MYLVADFGFLLLVADGRLLLAAGTTVVVNVTVFVVASTFMLEAGTIVVGNVTVIVGLMFLALLVVALVGSC